MEEMIGNYIKTLRTSRGWTLNQLAVMLDIDSAYLSKIENGKRDLDEKKLVKLCKIFNLDKSEMEKELVSEKIAKTICAKDFDHSILDLAQEKVISLKNGYNSNHTEYSFVDEPDLFGENDWRLKEFSNPSAEIRIGTLFSGIGAIEHAFKRLDLNYSIIFAGDIDPHVKQSFLANYEIASSDWHIDVTDSSAK